MPIDKLPPFIREVLRAREFGLLDDDLGRAVTRIIGAELRDPVSEQIVHSRLYYHDIQRALQGDFPPARLTQGDFCIGLDVQEKRRLMCLAQCFNEHSLTLSGSGGGKTTKSRWNVLQLAGLVQGLWLFDLRKREFAPLKPYLRRLGVELIIVPARKAKLNPLQVPVACNPRDYAPNMADMLVRTLKLPPGATRLAHMTTLASYDNFGVLEGSTHYPTLFDFREEVARNRRANPQSREAMIAALDQVLMSIGDILRYRVSWKTSDLATRKIVFELGGVSEMDQDLILNTILLGEFCGRIAQGVSNPKMDLYINCDEAARLVGQSDSSISDMIGLGGNAAPLMSAW